MHALALSLLALSSAAFADDATTAADEEGDGNQGTLDSLEPSLNDRGPVPIINGNEATEDDWPMAGAMLMDATWRYGGHDMNFRMFVCSSTLIAPDVVLLAAHCVDGDSFTYGYGSLDDIDIRWSRQADLSAHDGSSVNEWPTDAVAAWDWLYHPEWNLWQMSTGISNNKDISLLFLEEAVTDVPFAYVVTADEATQIAEGNEVFVVGWGQQTSATNPPAGTYGYKQMGASTISELGDYEFQVGLNTEDVRKCHGDSGGPTFMAIDTETTEPYRLVGVTSHAYDNSDCRRTGGVDTRVDAYIDWIDSEMRSRCEDGTRVWCEEQGLPVAPLPEPIDTGDTGDTGRGGKGVCGCATSAGAPFGAALGLLGVLGITVYRRG